MALVTCAECGIEITDQAELCPRCGYAVRRLRLEATVRRWKRRTLFWSVMWLGALIFFFQGLSHDNPLLRSFGLLLGLIGFLAIIGGATVVWWKHG